MNRSGKWYRDLCELVKRRDRACVAAYRRCLPFPLPYGAVHVHHIRHRGGCASMDREENLISLDPYIHAELHGGRETEYRHYIYTYMESEEVAAWRAAHAEEIEEIMQSKEDFALRQRQRKHKTKKPLPPWRRDGLGK